MKDMPKAGTHSPPRPGLMQEAFPPIPLCWRALTPQEREDQVEALREWIDWLVGRYALDQRTVPPCWEQHGALLEELSALRTAWLTAFAVTAPGTPRWTGTLNSPPPGSDLATGYPGQDAAAPNTDPTPQLHEGAANYVHPADAHLLLLTVPGATLGRNARSVTRSTPFRLTRRRISAAGRPNSA